MLIKFSPIRSDDVLTVACKGNILTICGIDYDFGPIPEGATLPRDAAGCPWLVSDVERAGGRLELTLMLPHGENAPDTALFPEPIVVTHDGPVPLPGQSTIERTPR